jgi:hypothetical protein
LGKAREFSGAIAKGKWVFHGYVHLETREIARQWRRIKLFHECRRWVRHEFSMSLVIDTKSNSVPRQPLAVLNAILKFPLIRPHQVLVQVELVNLPGPILLPDLWAVIAFGEICDADEEQDVSSRFGKRTKTEP